jgi:hypothetical protein
VTSTREAHVTLEFDGIVVVTAFDGLDRFQAAPLRLLGDKRQHLPSDTAVPVVRVNRNGDFTTVSVPVAGQHGRRDRQLAAGEEA